MLHEPTPSANPLAVFNMRQLDFCPVHFESMSFSNLRITEKDILNWIHTNTEGRFFLKMGLGNSVRVGFENHSEASYFAIIFPSINQYNDPFA